jgi:uracil-DNA glycosylase
VRRVALEPTFESWQAAARALLRDRVPPEAIAWEETHDAGAAIGETPSGPSGPVTRVPREFVELAGQAARHPDPGRWAVLYAVLWRLVHERGNLLADPSEPLVRRLRTLAADVRQTVAPPNRAPGGLETPAPGAAAFVPAGADLPTLQQAAARCTGCDLYRHATRTVFGQGPGDARVVLVGEQPGDQEDLRGAPFVGPAGEVLDRALVEVGLVRERLYVTNAVKHFKFVPRGKRRIHQTPGTVELTACRPWLEAEIGLIRPETLVCLGATAARALLGPTFRLMREHGRVVATPWAPRTLATLHPSAVLRGEDEAAQARLYRMLVDDLRIAAA